ncbi:hypothetical protein [Micromonospora marina]|uniref:hypothetical protein n=1 Tax=Micromonospora marina TaxID=307120 RepID=UPI003D728801
MLHLREIAPADQSPAVADLLAADPGVTHLVVLPGAARQPVGDYITNVAVASAYGVWHEAAGSALQLVINLAAIVLAGLLTLAVQLCWWRHVARRAALVMPRQRADQRPSSVRASRRPRRDAG